MVGQVENIKAAGYGKVGYHRRNQLSKRCSEHCTEQHDREESCGNSEEIRQGPAIAIIQPHCLTADRIGTRGECGYQGKGQGGKHVDLHTIGLYQ
ncbi:hypothetical protein SDC9_47221 [bioreactor metagenome]|uniref:Uncharacterized protein n=1 Tax=bioreactor metagenome TaxID=1076179 RepID=A0A644WF99_9ZZZZ